MDKNVDKYVQFIKHGTHINPSTFTDTIFETVDYDNKNKDTLKTNTENNTIYIEEQIRLNNLKEIKHSKQITIYVLYFILLISCGLLVYLLK